MAHSNGYVLRPIGGDAISVKFTESRDPIRDVHIDVRNGWRSIGGSKISESQIAFYIAEDLRCPVVEEVHGPIGDWDFDLRWKIGDPSSINAALMPYGIEIVEAPEQPATFPAI